MIAGIAVAVVVLLILTMCVVWIVKRKRSTKQRDAEDARVTAKLGGSSSARLLITNSGKANQAALNDHNNIPGEIW